MSSTEMSSTGLNTTPRGLQNMGNTCFFNSAMQCIMHTHHLYHYMNDVGSSKDLEIPECTITMYDEKVDVAGAKIHLESKPDMQFVRVFYNFMKQFYIGGKPTHAEVFEQVARRAPRFRGYHQQDSHELLRYLIDGLQHDELDGIKQSINRYLKSTEHDNVEKLKRAFIRFTKPAIDCVFGGTLLQSIRCSACDHVSTIFEPFLDLSLPIPRFANPFPVKQGQRLSKHQQKKANKSKKNKNKKRKAQMRQEKFEAEKSRQADDLLSLDVDKSHNDANKSADSQNTQPSGLPTAIEKPDGYDSGADAGDDDQESDDEAVSTNMTESSTGDVSTSNSTIDFDFARPLSTINPPEGKTVLSALNHFTTIEHLRGSNAYECENCCVPVNKQNGNHNKKVEAFKRYLIYTPPPVLTLQLKRFEKTTSFGRQYTSKINGHVDFPLILDLAPFCVECADRRVKGQTKILYSLYGIVVHSGGLHGGHYIAYVRSRKSLPQIEAFYKQASFPDASSVGDFAQFQRLFQSENTATDFLSEEEALSAREEALSGSAWYYISDSHVQKTSEERVLASEAYLLFYERFY